MEKFKYTFQRPDKTRYNETIAVSDVENGRVQGHILGKQELIVNRVYIRGDYPDFPKKEKR